MVLRGHRLELGHKARVGFGLGAHTGCLSMGRDAYAQKRIVFNVDPDHQADLAAVSFTGCFKGDAPGFAVETTDKKSPFKVSVLDVESVGDGVVGGPFENGSNGGAFDELQHLIIDSFLGAVAQIGQHTS